MHIEEMTAKEIIEVLLNRDDGLNSIDSSVLADELADRCGGMDAFGTETLVEALEIRKNVDTLYNYQNYLDVHVFIDKGDLNTFSGKRTVLIVG